MLDGLFGSKFSNKCKHSIKCIRTRLDPIRKKKQAVVRYLRRDVAELLSRGHDLNAFGRMEALIVEMNQSSCYDMIEQYCADILNQLSLLQKQRECPDEAKEAISTLVFAAARFSDLPELCDLRRVFTERFGGNMESFVNSEFVKRAQDKTFSDEKKLQLMQGIAEEFSVRFDPKDVRRRMSNPAEAKSDLPKKPVPSRNEESNLKIPKSHFNDVPKEKRSNPSPVASAHKQDVQVQQKVVWDEARELRAKQQVVRNEQKESRAELEGSWARPKASWARPRELRAEPNNVQAEPKDIHVVPSKPERTDLYHRNYKFQAEDTPKKYHKEKTRHVHEKEGPYSIDEEKPGLCSVRTLSEKEQGSNVLLSDRSRVRDNGSDYIRSESNIDREAYDFVKPSKGKGINMAPPYTKPKTTRAGRHKEEEINDSDPYAAERPPIRPAKDERVANMDPPYVKPGFEQQTKHDHHYGTSDGERPRPISVRSRVPKPPVADAKTGDDFDEANMNRTPSMRQKHGHRHETARYDDDDDVYAKQRHREKHDNGVNGDIHDARHHLRRHKSQVSSAKYNEVEEDNAIDYGNLLHGTPRSHRRHKEWRSSRHEPEKDDEERMMDKLLMHYSRKGLAGPEHVREKRAQDYATGNEPVKERSRARPPPPPPLTTRPSMDRAHHGPERVSSLPVDQGHEEAIRVPARAMSLQPDLYSPNGGRRHPNLPDYDELQARLRALRNA